MKSEDISFLHYVLIIIIIHVKFLRDATLLIVALAIDLHRYFQFTW